MITKRRLDEIFSNITKSNILVVGDIMIDEYVWGSVHRISPEAPVPVVNVEKESKRLGGAANVIQNLATVGVTPYIASVCGADTKGEELQKDLEESGCNCVALLNSSDRLTTVKTRIMAHHQQVVRVDKEISTPITTDEEELLIQKITALIGDIHGVIISDYGKGVITPTLLHTIIDLCTKNNIFISVDPKEEHFDYYRSVNVITPNLKEGYASLGKTLTAMPSMESIIKTGWEIVDTFNLGHLLLTLSEKGMALFDSENREYTHFETVAQDVFDVTGAGDTVISLFAAAIAAGASTVEATYISNHAAGISVAEVGTASVTPDEIRTAILGDEC